MNKYIKIIALYSTFYSSTTYSSEQQLPLVQQLATLSWTLSVKTGILESQKEILLQDGQKTRSFSICSSNDAKAIANSEPLNALFTSIANKKEISEGYKQCLSGLLTGKNTEEQLVVTPTKISMRDKEKGFYYCSSPLKKNETPK